MDSLELAWVPDPCDSENGRVAEYFKNGPETTISITCYKYLE